MTRLFVLLIALSMALAWPAPGCAEDLPRVGRVDPAGCDPEYPPAALALGQTGTVVLSLLVDRAGTVRDGRIAVSSSFPLLDAGTLDTFSRCRVFPHIEDGQPITAWLTIVVHWELKAGPPPPRQAARWPLTRPAV